ncbi:MAG: hypothetical protein WCX74_02230 [Candidatus Paceibacterota bacterium]
MVFYQCSKCKKKWQHPVSICPFCFSELEVIRAKEAKVIASSKVSIPSLLHPKVPYYALVIEDEHGNRYAYKSMENRKVGDSLNLETDGSYDAVAIWKVNYNLLDAIEKIADLSCLQLKKDTKVLVLPTLVAPVHNYMRENTSLEFLDAVLSYLEEKGVKNIKIATQSFDDMPIEAMAQKSGLLDVCLKHKMVPFDLSAGEFESIGKAKLSKELKNNDIILNLAELKYGKASSVENLLKLFEKQNYQALKYLHGEECLGEIIKEINNVFTLGEAMHPQRIDKFPIFRSLVFGSRNASSLDAVFNATGMVKNIPKQLASINISNIPTVGRTISEVQRNVDLVL